MNIHVTRKARILKLLAVAKRPMTAYEITFICWPEELDSHKNTLTYRAIRELRKEGKIVRDRDVFTKGSIWRRTYRIAEELGDEYDNLVRGGWTV